MEIDRPVNSHVDEVASFEFHFLFSSNHKFEL